MHLVAFKKALVHSYSDFKNLLHKKKTKKKNTLDPETGLNMVNFDTKTILWCICLNMQQKHTMFF